MIAEAQKEGVENVASIPHSSTQKKDEPEWFSKRPEYITEPALYLKPRKYIPSWKKALFLIRTWLHMGIMCVCCVGLGNLGQVFGYLISFIFPKLGKQMISFSGLLLFSFICSMECIGRLKLEISGDDIPIGENAVCIGNHISDADFVLFMCIAFRKGMLGNVKYMAKEAMKHWPFVGWGMRLFGMIFLKRNWQQDKSTIYNTFSHLTATQEPVWVISFCEGTRITLEKHSQSYRFAKERDLQFYNQVLIPRTKGFVTMIKHFKKSHVKYIYDFTFSMVDGIVSIFEVLNYGCGNGKICVNIKRYPLSDLPDDEESLTKWCFECYARKDKLITDLVKSNTGSYVDEPIRHHPMLSPHEWWVKPFEESSSENDEEKKEK